MSITTVRNSTGSAARRHARYIIPTPGKPWVRDPSWQTLGTVGNTEQKFIGLLAVYPESTFAALTAAGNYTIDWGDGTTENINTGVQANHLYDYTAAALANTNAPVTLTDSTDTVDRTAHGYIDGDQVQLFDVVTTTGVTSGQTYYVVNATANTFQVATSAGGTPLTLTNNGTAALLPFKQAIVTVTPQSGQNLTTLNLNVKHSQSGLQAYETGWLDIELGSPQFTSTGFTIRASANNVRMSMLERAAVKARGSKVNLSYTFYECYALQSVSILDTATVTSMSYMLSNCYALQYVPLFDTAAVTDMSAMFQTCWLLTTVPLFNTAAVTNMSSMFQNCALLTAVPLFNTAAVTTMRFTFQSCFNLTTVPLFNTAAVTDMTNMLDDCRSLQTVPLFNTVAVTNMTNMFRTCYSLITVPLFNTAAVTNMSNMFQTCTSLTSVPLFNTAAVTNMAGMFQNCYALTTVPLFNTAAVTAINSMFNNCPSLITVPLFNTAAATNMSSMFNSCYSLSSVPALDCSAVTSSANFATMFLTCNSIARIQATGFKYTFSVASNKLGTTQLEELFGNLALTTGQTLTITNNYGAVSYSLSGTTTSGSTTVTMASTANLATGMEITGTGISSAVAVTMQDTGDTVTRTAHGLANNTRVSFATIVTTTGIAVYTPYYVVNATADTFQVSDTLGGAAKALTTDGSGTIIYGVTITAITPNTNITLSVPASASATITTNSSVVKQSIARLRGWTVAN